MTGGRSWIWWTIFEVGLPSKRSTFIYYYFFYSTRLATKAMKTQLSCWFSFVSPREKIVVKN